MPAFNRARSETLVRDKEELLLLLLDDYAAGIPRPELPDEPHERTVATAMAMHQASAEHERPRFADHVQGRSLPRRAAWTAGSSGHGQSLTCVLAVARPHRDGCLGDIA
jgi:hypothetical protein